MRDFSNTSESFASSKLKSKTFRIENHAIESIDDELKKIDFLSIVTSTVVYRESVTIISKQQISSISKIAKSTISIKRRQNSIITAYINCLNAKRRKIAITDALHSSIEKHAMISEELTRMKYDITKEEYEIIELNRDSAMIGFIIRYLHSVAKFETLSFAISSISISLSFVKSINLFSNSSIIRTAVDIARDSVKLKHWKGTKRKFAISRLVAEGFVFLSIFDKKISEIDWAAKISSSMNKQSYHFIDCFESIISKNSVWYFKEFFDKKNRNKLVNDMRKRHRIWKIDSAIVYKMKCKKYVSDKLIFERDLLKKTLNHYEMFHWSITLSKKTILYLTNSKQIYEKFILEADARILIEREDLIDGS